MDHHDIFFGIDGTGDDEDKTYYTKFARSFVKAFHDCYVWGWKRYSRGPTFWGSETGMLADLASRDIRREFSKLSQLHGAFPRIFLCGYSRGGAAAIHASQILGERGVPVHALILFDAVDRSVAVPFNWSITPNVRYARHAVRKFSTLSRPYFGNCGTSAENTSKTDLKIESFFCTHGAMGGMPYEISERNTFSTNEGILPKRAEVRPKTSGVKADCFPSKRMQEQSFIYEPTPKFISNITGVDGIPTRVTFHQDNLGSKAAWNWMFQNYRILLKA